MDSSFLDAFVQSLSYKLCFPVFVLCVYGYLEWNKMFCIQLKCVRSNNKAQMALGWLNILADNY